MAGAARCPGSLSGGGGLGFLLGVGRRILARSGRRAPQGEGQHSAAAQAGRWASGSGDGGSQ